MWVELQSLKIFVQQLRDLEIQRQGQAELSSMSPDQFWLRIFSTDSLGYMALVGWLSRWEYTLNWQHLLEFGFAFDPSTLPSIVKNFEAISDGVLNQSLVE